MKAQLIANERLSLTENMFIQFRLWQVPKPVKGSTHIYKYSLVLVVDDVCVLRYDNEAGKGDHKHIGLRELPYEFISPEQLYTDFMSDVEQWRTS